MNQPIFDSTEIAKTVSSIAFFTDKLLAMLKGCVDKPCQLWFLENKIDPYNEETYYEFAKISIYTFPQTWGSTSCGWGGVGGAAMTTAYTTAIHNEKFKVIAVFWGGKLGYVIHANEKTLGFLKNGHMPGRNYLNVDDVIYNTKL